MGVSHVLHHVRKFCHSYYSSAYVSSRHPRTAPCKGLFFVYIAHHLGETLQQTAHIAHGMFPTFQKIFPLPLEHRACPCAPAVPVFFLNVAHLHFRRKLPQTALITHRTFPTFRTNCGPNDNTGIQFADQENITIDPNIVQIQTSRAKIILLPVYAHNLELLGEGITCES